MKKPHQTKTGKAQNALQKAERKNFQKGGTKKGAVFLLESNPTNPTVVPRKKKAARRSYKLREQTIAALISSIEDAADAPIEVHCGCAGISRDTYYDWRKKAEAEPESEHAKQMAKIDKALFQAWKRLHQAAVKHKASEVLFRRHGEFYPSEKVRMDLTTDGMAIESSSNFQVLLELHPPQAEEKPFEIEEGNGSRWKWTASGGNGEQP